MTTVDQLGDELAVDPHDIRVLIEQMLDVHDEELPDVLAAEVRQVLNPTGERNPPDPVRDLAAQYRDGGDRALLQELEMHGHRKIVHALTMERLLQDPAERDQYTVQIDAWLAGGNVPHVLTWHH